MSDTLRDAAVEAVGISVGNKSMLTGAGAGIAGWMVDVNWLGVIGTLIALAGLLVNVYFHVRRDRREAVESAARIDAIRASCERA